MPATESVPLEGASSGEPLLEQGYRLSREEFERRYEQMPDKRKAELIEGIVYTSPPIRAKKHAEPQLMLATALGVYTASTPGVACFDNATVRLDLDNEPQPDLVLLKVPGKGGQTRTSADDYIVGAPELAVEIVASSLAYDLHQKKEVYRRNGVREYLAWVTGENRLIWWELRQGQYHELVRTAEGWIKSGVFLGLWLDTAAFLRGDPKQVLATLRQGIESAEHAAFVAA
jgi:Uma2 family endonuclease